MTFEQLGPWIYGSSQLRRFTQNSPIMEDVWLAFGQQPDGRIDLLLEPDPESSPAVLSHALLVAPQTAEQAVMRLGYNQLYGAAALTFEELVRGALPLSRWWREHLLPPGADDVGQVLSARRDEIVAGLENPMREQGRQAVGYELPGALIWFTGLLGRIEWERRRDPGDSQLTETEPPPGLSYEEIVDVASELLQGLRRAPRDEPPLLSSVHRNRPARTAVWRSRTTIKADRAIRQFGLRCSGLRWAVLDSGIDATHPAFARRTDDLLADTADGLHPAGDSRIRATYDFTRLRDTMAGRGDGGSAPFGRHDEIAARVYSGRSIDWELILPLLEVRKDDYVPPAHEHGTHVAGVLAGDWRQEDPQGPADHTVMGVCPDMELYDLRVFDHNGAGDEFAILAALQFVRWTNGNARVPAIHGVNLSLSLDHEAGEHRCGRTPICDECDRVVSGGTVVVAAAGNHGRAWFSMTSGKHEGHHRHLSITDPGNARDVITVGATHQSEPANYGVSSFSSRGPTGDGRIKPDLVAPGENITAPVPNLGLKTLDGTSLAATHVSGAAALILAAHPELIGRPAEIKRVLCESATDLGREACFQGSGVLDALSAIDAV
jgi:hypothetical protein